VLIRYATEHRKWCDVKAQGAKEPQSTACPMNRLRNTRHEAGGAESVGAFHMHSRARSIAVGEAGNQLSCRYTDILRELRQPQFPGDVVINEIRHERPVPFGGCVGERLGAR